MNDDRNADASGSVRVPGLFEAVGWTLVRAPALPVDRYPATADALVGVGTGRDGGGTDTVAHIRAALAVASASLLRRLDDEGGEIGETSEPWSRADGKLLRYLIRMSTRPTPFGMFAGIALAEFGESTDLYVSSDRHATRMRPDMAWLLGLVASLEARAEVRRELRVFANPAAWIHGGRARLAERCPVDGSGGDGQVSTRATAAVRYALEKSSRPIRWQDLAAELLAVRGATAEKVDALLTELWSQTFLLTELRPPLTTLAPAHYVAKKLENIPAAHGEHELLVGLLASMASWDHMAISGREAVLNDIRSRAASAIPSFAGDLVQVDTALLLSGRVSFNVGREAARAAEILFRISPERVADPLAAYHRAFASRYGTDREIPILELLDPDIGLGTPFAGADPDRFVDVGRIAARETALWRLASNALRDRQLAVTLDEPTLAKLALVDVDPASAPISVDLSVFVLAGSIGDVDAGHFRLLIGPNLGGQAAGRNLGRFADLLGPAAIDALASVASIETSHEPDDMHAELVYLPRRGRLGNVTIRPSIYDYEVPVGTGAHLDDAHEIPLSELVVGSRDDSFYVRWTRQPKHLRIHAGHMLNSREAPWVCRFLEEVGRSRRGLLHPFQWGAVGVLPFLPRVEAGTVVLAPAQWRVDATIRDESLRPDDPAFEGRLEQWRATWMVPRQIYLTLGDNRLLLDLGSPMHVEEFRLELKRLVSPGVLVLEEPLPALEHAWVEGREGRFMVEFIVPLVQRSQRTTPAGSHRAATSQS